MSNQKHHPIYSINAVGHETKNQLFIRLVFACQRRRPDSPAFASEAACLVLDPSGRKLLTSTWKT